MLPLIAQNLPQIRVLCEKHGVRRLEIFGSAVSGGFDAARSDVDFFVDFDPAPEGKRADQYFGMLFGLEAILGRKVDLAEFGTITNPYVLRSVDAARKPLYVAA